jgi:hypothetical protein
MRLVLSDLVSMVTAAISRARADVEVWIIDWGVKAREA